MPRHARNSVKNVGSQLNKASSEFLAHFVTLEPNPRVLTAAELREVDRLAVTEFGIPSIVLMENAAIRAAQAILSICEQSVLVLAGSGNNGGDGLAVARQLHAVGVEVHVVLITIDGQMSDDTAANLISIEQSEIALEHVDSVEHGDVEQAFEQRIRTKIQATRPVIIVDALLGTGLSRPIEGPICGAVRATNNARDSAEVAHVISLDVPTGLDADLGSPIGMCIRATKTITFAACKAGFSNPESQHVLGDVLLVPIGVPPELLRRFGVPLSLHPSQPGSEPADGRESE